MQTHGGAAAEAAITSAERVIRASVKVDWNGNGLFDHPLSDLDRYLDAVTLDKALTGPAPEEIFLVEGSSAAELKLTLNGEYEGETLTRIFSPFNTDSLFFGTQTVDREIVYTITVETSEGLVSYPQFIGNVRTITPNRADATVEITALDRADKMRRPVQLVPWAMSDQHVVVGEIDSQLVRSDWVIDNAARLCDISVTDKRPVYRSELGVAPDGLDGVHLWVSGTGSYLPTIGWVDNMNASTFPNPGGEMYNDLGPKHRDLPVDSPNPRGLAGVGMPIVGGPFGAVPSDRGVIRYWAADQDQINADGVHYLGFTINTSGPDGQDFQTVGKHEVLEVFIGWARALYVLIENGQVWSEMRHWSDDDTNSVQASSSRVNIPTGQDHVDVFVHWDNSAGTESRVYVRAGANDNGGFQVDADNVDSDYVKGADQIKGRVSIGHALSLSDIYFATRNSNDGAAYDPDSAWRPATYAAVLDRGINRFSFMPSTDRQEAWTLVQNVAAAEFGSVFWDETGVLRFWNWETMLAKRDNVVRTFSLDHVDGLQVTNAIDSVRNVYSIVTTQRRAQMDHVIYDSSDVVEFYVPERTTQRFQIWVDNIVSPLTWIPERYAGAVRAFGLPAWSDAVTHGYVVQYFGDLGSAGEGDIWTERDEFPTPEITTYFSALGNLTVRIRNRSDYPIRLAMGLGNESGQAAFRVRGTSILEARELSLPYEHAQSVMRYGARAWDLNSEWYQDALTQTRLLDVMLERTAEPQPTTDAITVAGDPRLQLGDVIRVTDHAGFGDAILLQAYGINRVFTKDAGLTDTLTVEMVPPGSIPDPDNPDPNPPEPEPTIRFNLCDNPSCKHDDDDYYGGTGRISDQDGMTRTYGYDTADNAICPKGDVKSGLTYIASAEIKARGGARSGTAAIHWYSRRGFIESAGEVGWSIAASNGVTRVYTAPVVAPPGSERMLLNIEGINGTVTIGSVLYEETDKERLYFDGDSPNATWDGKDGDSTSRWLAPEFTQEVL